MDEIFDTAEKKVLVEMVKFAQKRGMSGTLGDWKEFLKAYDKKLGSNLSDPTKRSNDVLVAFLKTFVEEDDRKCFAKIMQSHAKRNMVEQFTKNCPDDEIPEQRLVRLTLEHPLYLLDYSFLSNDEEWVVTKLSKKSTVMRSNEMLAVDCEMVLCEDGTEALVRVCIVDRNLQVKLDELVKPNKAVADYRTDITGISATDLAGVSYSLADVQKSIKKLLSNKTILVGHSLNNDLRALKLDHARVIDTSLIFTYLDGWINRRPSLNNLCQSVLGHEVRSKNAPHNCLDDACAAMKLVLAKLEHGFDKPIPLSQEEVPESELAKLLLHRIPKNVPTKELLAVTPGNFTIELKIVDGLGSVALIMLFMKGWRFANPKPFMKPQGENYSAFAIFKNPQEALQAYESVSGRLGKDSRGRPQKLVTHKLSTGSTITLYVRAMAENNSLGQILSEKRSLQPEETSGPLKKLKINETIGKPAPDQYWDHLEEPGRLKEEQSKSDLHLQSHCCDHLKEIEMMKEELSKRDLQITSQDKKISELRKRLKSKGIVRLESVS